MSGDRGQTGVRPGSDPGLTPQIVELPPSAADPPLRCNRGVSFVAPADRYRHAPDLCLFAVERDVLVARCSCWWSGTSRHGCSGEGTDLRQDYRAQPARPGVIGHYAAADAASGAALLARACEALATAGCTTAVGPMDGNTWRRYRFVTDRGTLPPFFLEPDNPEDWPQHWTRAGFSSCASYTSAMTADLSAEDPRTTGSLTRLDAAGISIRALDSVQIEAELRRIFALSTVAFSGNVFYAPISEEEFLTQTRALLPLVRPELILLAERHDTLVGFMFAVPDLLRAERGLALDTVILKSMAVDPYVSGMGLGGVLMDLVQREARRMGFRRAIHALMHETNASRAISQRYARTIRRYGLFSRPLAAVG